MLGQRMRPERCWGATMATKATDRLLDRRFPPCDCARLRGASRGIDLLSPPS